MWFIDKLNVQQSHDFDLPVIGEHGILRYDIATGETISDTPRSKTLEGSYSSSIQISSNGNKVCVRGNPSRFNRTDNLFGYTTFDQCIGVYNKILGELGLPPFTKCKLTGYRQNPEDKKAQKLTSGGALLDHVDFTRNFAVGAGSERAFIRGLSSHKIGKGREPKLYPNGMTVDWGVGSEYTYRKVYCKSFDLKKHRGKRLKGVSDTDYDYYDALTAWCDEIGMLREEHSFKQKFMRRHELQYYGITRESDFYSHLGDIEQAMQRLSVMNTRYDMIANKLIEEGVVKSVQAANSTQCVYLKWLHGDDLGMGKSQFYEHRRRLLSLGIDISLPNDMTRTPLTIRTNELIDVQVVTPPAWYRMPSKPMLSLVA
jgi:hypothetical protein